MKHTNIIFHQLLKSLPRQRFQDAVDRHQGDKRIRTLSCWDQLVALLFAQLTGRQSLRDLVDCFNSQKNCHYHLGTRTISRSSLSDANKNRPSEIFLETFYYLLEQVREHLPNKAANEMVRLIDSTTIDLNLNQYEWAKFRSTKGGIKLHTVYDPNVETPVFFQMTDAKVHDCKALNSLPILPGITYVVDRAYDDYSWYYGLDQQNSIFVGRMKSSACYEVIETLKATGNGILSDEIIRLTSDKARKTCPISLRRVTFLREEDQKVLVFITNDMARTAEEIAALYKQRWQIELFFKWIKQNLKIKRFIGRNENAVWIQILVAMIAYLLLKRAQQSSFSSLSLQQINRLISVNITSRRSLIDLLHPDSAGYSSPPEAPDQLSMELVYI